VSSVPVPPDAGVVDAHAHLVPLPLLTQLSGTTSDFPSVSVTPHDSTFRVAFNGGAPTRPVAPRLYDVTERRAWLDDNGIDRQLVGGWLDIFGYDLQPDEGAAWAEALTDAMAAEAADDPRLAVLGTVPLQSPKLAAEAVQRNAAAGRPGVMIATRAPRRELDEESYEPLWAAADAAGAIVYLHPGFGSTSDRYHDFGLVNGLGRLEDTTVTLARLLYAGVPAKWPGMKLVVAHAGGGLPYVLGRLVRNHALNADTTCDPMESFAQLYFDSVVFDTEALRFLLSKVGADRVVLGSDYPFPIGDLRPRDVLAPLEPQVRAQVEGGAAGLMNGARP
jgi:aminocarboxymuconate-semialdehyde decarboxylase